MDPTPSTTTITRNNSVIRPPIYRITLLHIQPAFTHTHHTSINASRILFLMFIVPCIYVDLFFNLNLIFISLIYKIYDKCKGWKVYVGTTSRSCGGTFAALSFLSFSFYLTTCSMKTHLPSYGNSQTIGQHNKRPTMS